MQRVITHGEITGYRAWVCHIPTLQLRSLWVPHFWIPGEPMYGSLRSPFTGVFAYREATAITLSNFSYAIDDETDWIWMLIAGEVLLWGDVMEHTRGWRAQYAYPHALYHTGSKKDIIDDVARRYGIRAYTPTVDVSTYEHTMRTHSFKRTGPDGKPMVVQVHRVAVGSPPGEAGQG